MGFRKPAIAPNQKQAAMAGMAQQASPGIQWSPEQTPAKDTEESLRQELDMLNEAQSSGRMTQEDYLLNLKKLQNRWEGIAPGKPYFSKPQSSVSPAQKSQAMLAMGSGGGEVGNG